MKNKCNILITRTKKKNNKVSFSGDIIKAPQMNASGHYEAIYVQ